MKKNIILYILLFITISGCKNWLEEDIKTFTNPQVLMTSRAGVEQAVNGIYAAAKVRWYRGPREIQRMNGYPTDELFTKGTNDLQRYEWLPANGEFVNPWNGFTEGVSRANMVLDNLPEIGTLGIAGERQFLELKRGEALFLRALHLFNQVNYFGPVALMTSYNDVELYPSNATVPEFFDQIIVDLIEAETLLPNWQHSEHEPGRASRGAAKSLLAKVYLYRATHRDVQRQTDDFQKALLKFKEVIDNEGYDLWKPYKVAFLPDNKNKKEDVFSYQCEANGQSPSSFYTESLPQPPPTGQSRGRINNVLTDFAYNSFEPGDQRKEDGHWNESHRAACPQCTDLGLLFTGYYVVRPTGRIHFTDRNCFEKFYDPVYSYLSTNNHGTNWPIIRFADVLLMYAEAINEVNNGPNNEAYLAINKVRERAGLLPLSGLSKTEFFDAIYYERLWEFYGEGMRFLDLKRWGLLQRAVNERGFQEPYHPQLVVEDKHYYWPIPQDEIDANPNLKQNTGY